MQKIEQEHIAFTYEYDEVGNIVSEVREYKNTNPSTIKTTTYAYDALGQLIRVNDQNDTTSGEGGTTWTYLYDRGGNILSKSRYAYAASGTSVGTALETIPYTYGDSNWKDKLTAYNGVAITYDAIGNPLNDGTWNYAWTSGRQLSQMSKDGMSVLFKYDHNGLRSQKSVTENGTTTTTDYIYHGKLLAAMTRGSDVLRFEYDAQSRPTMVMFNGIRYVYLHNIQSDIVGIMDASGNLVVEYRYDAWGKPLSTTGSMAATLGKINPLRYRGYVYDEETGMYYLIGRYYNALQYRFGNRDVVNIETAGQRINNIFNYARNNPIVFLDEWGFAPVKYSLYGTVEIDKNIYNYSVILGVGADGLGPENVGPPNGYRRTFPNKEIWYGPDGKPIHSRHWDNHGNPKKHPLVPHDHDWYDDDRGNRKQSSEGTPVNDKYRTPSSESNENHGKNMEHDIGKAAVIVGGGYLLYQLIKWGIAVTLAPVTGGGSLGIATVTP